VSTETNSEETGSEPDPTETEAFRRTCEYLVEQIVAGDVDRDSLESAKLDACSQYGSPKVPKTQTSLHMPPRRIVMMSNLLCNESLSGPHQVSHRLQS